MSTHIVKWDDVNNRFTAYCSDDKTKTEIGPVKWNDTANQLELHCGGNVYPVKWNDATNRLEAQGVAAGCCLDTTCCSGSLPDSFDVTISGVADCVESPNRIDCTEINGTYTLDKISESPPKYNYTSTTGVYPNTKSITVNLECNDYVWDLDGNIILTDLAIAKNCYSGSVTMQSGCSAGISTNDNISDDCGGLQGGYNGSAAITGNF